MPVALLTIIHFELLTFPVLLEILDTLVSLLLKYLDITFNLSSSTCFGSSSVLEAGCATFKYSNRSLLRLIHSPTYRIIYFSYHVIWLDLLPLHKKIANTARLARKQIAKVATPPDSEP